MVEINEYRLSGCFISFLAREALLWMLKMVMLPTSSSTSGHSGSRRCLNGAFEPLVVASNETGRGWPRWHYLHPPDSWQCSIIQWLWWVMLSTVRDDQTIPTRVTTGWRSVRSLARSSLVYCPSLYIPIQIFTVLIASQLRDPSMASARWSQGTRTTSCNNDDDVTHSQPYWAALITRLLTRLPN